MSWIKFYDFSFFFKQDTYNGGRGELHKASQTFQ